MIPRMIPRMISVIIPVRDAAATLGEQLAALAAQTWSGPSEVILADNGSTDGTRELAATWADRLPIRLIDASEVRGPSHARNRGAAAAKGDFLAFCDADDVVTPGWLDAMANAAVTLDVVTGPQDVGTINAAAVQQYRGSRADGLPQSRFLPYAPSCNLGVWADVFRATGGFNEEYRAAEDLEWSWRTQLASYSLGFAPDAVVHYRYRTSARGIARQAFQSGIVSARLYRDYRNRGLDRRPLGRVLRTWAWLVVRIPDLFVASRRGTWVRRASETMGRTWGSVRFRVLCL
jgi:glycosyltransferase involved in cell wall biosynthesis